MQLVSTSPAHYHSWAPADIAGRLARAIGEEIAALCERSDRLVGLGYAPLQHPDAAETALTEAVGESLRRLYYDSLVYEPELLEALVARVGADRVLLGSDFPFDMASEDPVGHVRAAAGLSDEQREAILGGTAAELLGIVVASG